MKKFGLALLLTVINVISVKAQFVSNENWNGFSRENKIYFLGNYVQYSLTGDLDYFEKSIDEIDKSSAGVGIGIVYSDRSRGITVEGVFRGTSAEKAGLRAGDVVLAVDGAVVRDMDGLGEAVKNSYSPVKLIVLRGDTVINFSINKKRFGKQLNQELKQAALKWRKKLLALKNRYNRFFQVLSFENSKWKYVLRKLNLSNDKALDSFLTEARDLKDQLNEYHRQMQSEYEVIQEKYLVPKFK